MLVPKVAQTNPFNSVRFSTITALAGWGGRELYPLCIKAAHQLNNSLVFGELAAVNLGTSFALGGLPIACTTIVHALAAHALKSNPATPESYGTLLLKNAFIITLDVGTLASIAAVLSTASGVQLATAGALAVAGAVTYLIALTAIEMFNSLNPQQIPSEAIKKIIDSKLKAQDLDNRLDGLKTAMDNKTKRDTTKNEAIQKEIAELNTNLAQARKDLEASNGNIKDWKEEIVKKLTELAGNVNLHTTTMTGLSTQLSELRKRLEGKEKPNATEEEEQAFTQRFEQIEQRLGQLTTLLYDVIEHGTGKVRKDIQKATQNRGSLESRPQTPVPAGTPTGRNTPTSRPLSKTEMRPTDEVPPDTEQPQ